MIGVKQSAIYNKIKLTFSYYCVSLSTHKGIIVNFKGEVIMNTYYDLLGVSVDADTATIEKAYKDITDNAYLDMVNSRISSGEYNRIHRACTEAKNTLCNDIARAAYDQKCGISRNQGNPYASAFASTGAHTTGTTQPQQQPQHDDDEYYDEDYEYDYDNGKKKSHRGLKIALATGAIVAVLGMAAWAAPKVIDSFNLKAGSQNIVAVGSGEQTPSETEGLVNEDKGPEQGDPVDPSETPEAQSQGQQTPASTGTGTNNNVEVKNYGSIEDDALVEERATKLLDEFNKAQMTNITTGLPYTKEEIKTLILYVNGVYTPETEEEAFDLYTEFLNFICAPINIDHTLIQSAYLGGEDSFKGDVEGFINNQQRPDIVSAFTFGDSYAAPYLYWLQQKYYDMRYTTDRAEATKIWNEVFQSYADVMKGDGFVLDGVTYHEKNILGLDKVGVSNLYILFGLNAEVFRTTQTKDSFEVKNHLISAVPEEQIDTVSYDEVSAWLNGACEDELIAVDDQGLPLITTEEEGRSLGELTQINTIYRARENFIKENTKVLSK